MNRRTLLKAAAAAGGALALQPAHAEPEPEPSAAAKGPPVWLDLDQKALDDAYDQSVWATNGKQVLSRYAALSDDVRARLGAPQRFSYGTTPVEGLDVYRARNNAPIQIFIHGGAWRSGAAKDWAFPADMFVHRGAHFVVPDFVSVTDAGGNLSAMAEQVRSAIAWTYRNAQRFGNSNVMAVSTMLSINAAESRRSCQRRHRSWGPATRSRRQCRPPPRKARRSRPSGRRSDRRVPVSDDGERARVAESPEPDAP